jgi:hypothetical protein
LRDGLFDLFASPKILHFIATTLWPWGADTSLVKASAAAALSIRISVSEEVVHKEDF